MHPWKFIIVLYLLERNFFTLLVKKKIDDFFLYYCRTFHFSIGFDSGFDFRLVGPLVLTLVLTFRYLKGYGVLTVVIDSF